MQAARIAQLESCLLSSGFGSTSTVPLSWPDPFADRVPFPANLKVMRPSPEPPVWDAGMFSLENELSVLRSSFSGVKPELDSFEAPYNNGGDAPKGAQFDSTRFYNGG